MQHSVFFDFAGHEFEAKVEELPQTIELDLYNVIVEGGRSAEETAKLIVLREDLKSLHKDNKPQNLRDSKGSPRIPPVRDPETREGLIPSLLKAVVKHNDHLGYVEPYKDVFSGYLPGDAEEENPTGTGDTSPSGSITNLPPPQGQALTQTPGERASGS